MKRGYQTNRYQDEERGEGYEARATYNECNGNDGYNTHYYTDDGYGTFNRDDDYVHANNNNNIGNCGDTEEYYGGCYYANGGYYCNDDYYGGYYNEYEGYSNGYVGPETGGYETNFPLKDEDSGPTPRESGRDQGIEDMCGIADQHKIRMATILKRKQMKIAKLSEGIENIKEGMIKLVRSMAKLNEISTQTAKTVEDELTEREEMAGIIERPGTQQQNDYRLANNRFAALMDDGEDHGGGPTRTEMCATNRHVAINNINEVENNMNNMMARGPMMRDINDDRSIGTTQSADTVRRSNCSHIIPTKRSMMTRGAAWNVIRERNWVQQTIADRDERWCPTNIEKKLSPADRAGAIEPAQFGKLLDNVDDLTWAYADSGCTQNI